METLYITPVYIDMVCPYYVTNSLKLAPQWAFGGWSLAPFHWLPGMKTSSAACSCQCSAWKWCALNIIVSFTNNSANPATFASHAGQHARLPQTLYVASDSTVPKERQADGRQLGWACNKDARTAWLHVWLTFIPVVRLPQSMAAPKSPLKQESYCSDTQSQAILYILSHCRYWGKCSEVLFFFLFILLCFINVEDHSMSSCHPAPTSTLLVSWSGQKQLRPLQEASGHCSRAMIDLQE